jgi:hypothetical protein
MPAVSTACTSEVSRLWRPTRVRLHTGLPLLAALLAPPSLLPPSLPAAGLCAAGEPGCCGARCCWAGCWWWWW